MTHQIDATPDRIEALEAELAVYKGKTRALAIYTDEDVNELFDRLELSNKNEQSAREGLGLQQKLSARQASRIVSLEAGVAELTKQVAEQRDRANAEAAMKAAAEAHVARIIKEMKPSA
jgi:hypothetical protein